MLLVDLNPSSADLYDREGNRVDYWINFSPFRQAGDQYELMFQDEFVRSTSTLFDAVLIASNRWMDNGRKLAEAA